MGTVAGGYDRSPTCLPNACPAKERLGGSDITDQIIDLAAECATDPVRWWVAAAYDWERRRTVRPSKASILAGRHPRRNPGSPVESETTSPCRLLSRPGHGIGKKRLIRYERWRMGLSTSEYCKVVCTAQHRHPAPRKTSPKLEGARMSITADWWDDTSDQHRSARQGTAKDWRMGLCSVVGDEHGSLCRLKK